MAVKQKLDVILNKLKEIIYSIEDFMNVVRNIVVIHNSYCCKCLYKDK